ncbi:hypothetical protein OPW39_17260 [Vibrio europaeus]|uniref:hypothetical protein n=1 Tax=Vibrio europaeus TaxID=300876 RepID=UPI00233F20CA|nr:hypothetical protein [Vibrio europaeus]MDC5870553.1 hypothetical protein [Vibrio europaeus]
MLKENSNKHQRQPQSEDRLRANIYKNRLIRCGVSKREAERLVATQTIEALKQISARQKLSTGYKPMGSHTEPNTQRDLAIARSSHGHSRVWSLRPSRHHRHLSCSRKRTKVDRALLTR